MSLKPAPHNLVGLEHGRRAPLVGRVELRAVHELPAVVAAAGRGGLRDLPSALLLSAWIP